MQALGKKSIYTILYLVIASFTDIDSYILYPINGTLDIDLSVVRLIKRALFLIGSPEPANMLPDTR